MRTTNLQTVEANGKECKKVLIAILFKALTQLARTRKSTITSLVGIFIY